MQREVHRPVGTVSDILEAMGFKRETKGFVRPTREGNVHVILEETNRGRDTAISIHHDVSGGQGAHYTRDWDKVPPVVWRQIQDEIYK